VQEGNGSGKLSFVHQGYRYFQRDLGTWLQVSASSQQNTPSRQVKGCSKLKELFATALSTAYKERYGNGQTIPVTAFRDTLSTAHLRTPKINASTLAAKRVKSERSENKSSYAKSEPFRAEGNREKLQTVAQWEKIFSSICLHHSSLIEVYFAQQ